MKFKLPLRLVFKSALAVLGALTLPHTAQAQLTIPGNNGQDQAFNPTTNTQVDLSAAVTGPWDTTDSDGEGVYDPEQWAVIYRFTEVNIPANVTVTFKNHASRAPVIWLVQGNVTIAGTVSLDGAGGASASGAAVLSEPGPGGFRGGRGFRTGVPGSAGMGPGGGGYRDSGSAGASYASSGAGYPSGAVAGGTYGNDGVFPLIGGSGGGGAGVNTRQGGGAGGGAILIATSGTLMLNGIVRANGGGTTDCCSGHYGGAGSGGAIRMVADVVGGSGGLSAIAGANGTAGGAGRIRVEANTITLTAAHVNSTGVPQTPPRIFREANDGVPTITSMTLNGQAVPDDPASYPSQDVALLNVDEEDTVPLAITAENVPEGSTVNARVVRLSGVEEIVPAAYNGPSGNQTTWLAEIPVAGGFSTIQVHAVLP
jgi:hypothetical protein